MSSLDRSIELAENFAKVDRWILDDPIVFTFWPAMKPSRLVATL
jgi:hypothetical protein